MLVQFPGLGVEVFLNRVAFSVFGFDIYWYAVCITFGAVLGFAYAFWAAKEHGVESDPFVDVLMAGFVSGIIGARFYYVIFTLDSYNSFFEMINFRDGGMAIYGGLIFGVLGAYLMARKKKLAFVPMLDLVSITFFIAQSIGRWGNFFNQEAFGGNTTLPWGMISDGTKAYLRGAQANLLSQGIVVDPNMAVHPCFLYESIWCIIGAVLLFIYRKKRKFEGELFLLCIGWYGLGRFFIEGLRTDSLLIAGVRVSQLVAVACVVAAVGAIVYQRRQLKTAK